MAVERTRVLGVRHVRARVSRRFAGLDQINVSRNIESTAWHRLPSIQNPNPRSPSLTPSPLNQRLRTIRALHVVYCPSNILNTLHFQHPTDNRCLGRSYKGNGNRPFQKSLRCRDRISKFSRDILELLQEREKAFKDFREGNRSLISCLSPAVNVIQAFSDVLGEAVSLVSHKCHLVTLLT
jgi:hypothetical protein